jgi:hypothetical protein
MMNYENTHCNDIDIGVVHLFVVFCCPAQVVLPELG